MMQLGERFYRYRASDRLLAHLSIAGPQTLEQLSAELHEDPYRVNQWLYFNRMKGFVRLIERKQHRNQRGMKCGKWQVTDHIEAFGMSVARLVAARYGQHKTYCEAKPYEPCTCGLADLLRTEENP